MRAAASMRERDDLRHALAAQVAGEEAEVKAVEASRIERETTKVAKESELDGSWEIALRQAASGLEKLELQLREVHRGCRQSVRSPRAKSAMPVPILPRQSPTSNRHRTLSRIPTEVRSWPRNPSRESLVSSTFTVVWLRRRTMTPPSVSWTSVPLPSSSARAGRPRSPRPVSKTAEQDSSESRQLIRGLEDDLRRAEGALSQVGGDYVRDKSDEARRAVEAAREREHALEIEFRPWQLLCDVLIEAGRDDAQHLGKALVGPVSSRMADLTDGRYGEIAIGPQLDARGILLEETSADSISSQLVPRSRSPCSFDCQSPRL